MGHIIKRTIALYVWSSVRATMCYQIVTYLEEILSDCKIAVLYEGKGI